MKKVLKKEELKEMFCMNKEEILRRLEINSHFSVYMDKVLKIIKELDLPDLEEMFDYNKHKNEALIYNMIDDQESIFPITGVSIDRIYDIEIDEYGYSHRVAYSIPIIIIPMGNNCKYINKECLESIDNNEEDNYLSYNTFNHFNGFKK